MDTEFNKFLKDNNIRSAYSLEPITRGFFSFDNGWLNITMELMKEALDNGWSGLIYQAKEKFGELRFYAPDLHYEIEDKYLILSRKTCEICGKKGQLHEKHGWYKTLCKEHADKLHYRSVG